jgi:protein disulfide-isomerase A1
MDRPVLLLLVFGLLASVATVSADEVDDKHVVVLTSKNYDDELAAQEFMLVEFYAPWCGHCKKLQPHYAEAAATLHDEGVTNVRLAKVDCTTVRDVCDKNGVQGYPTVKWFRKGQDPIDFDGQRTAAGIIDYVKRFSGPVLTELKNKEDAEKFQKSSSVVIVAFTDDDASRKTVEEAAEGMRAEASFGIASPDLSPSGKAGLYAFLSFADEPVAFEGEFSKPEDIATFVKTESFPLVQEISPENYKRYIERNLPLVWVFLEKEGRDANVEVLRGASAESKGKLSWVYLDAHDYGRHGQNMGLSDKYPGIVIDDHIAKKRYLYPDDSKFESDALREWAGKVLRGDVAPFIKSEPIPENNDGPMVKVVGNNFKDIVLDTSKDVMLEFYSPGCRFCIELEPKYTALSNVFKDDPTVVISKVDGTANDVPLDVEGFPTVFFFPADNKDKPLRYDGERNTTALARFIATHSKTLSEERKKAILESKDDGADEEEEDTEKDEL